MASERSFNRKIYKYKNDQKISALRNRLDELSTLNAEWSKLCEHSVEMGIGSVDMDSQDELEHRFDITDRDITIIIRCVSSAIAREKSNQKQNDVYKIGPRETLELKRKLGRASEELEMRNTMIAANALRQLEEASATTQAVGKEHVVTDENKYSKIDSHIIQLHRHRREIVECLSARSVAYLMFKKGAITRLDLERTQKSSEAESAESLVNILMEQSYVTFLCFKAALRETKQDDVYSAITDIGKEIHKVLT